MINNNRAFMCAFKSYDIEMTKWLHSLYYFSKEELMINNNSAFR